MNKKIIIIEDQALIAESIKQKVVDMGYKVDCVCDNCDEALTAFQKLQPDIIISDVYLKGIKTGVHFAQEVNKICPTPIIFITAFSNDTILNQISELNNISYLTKPFTDSQLQACLNIANKRCKATKPLLKLSKREIIIVKHLAKGKSSKEIADIEFISFHTVETHRKNIMQKLNIKTTAEIVSIAVKSGLL
ncbi:MAG: DNA-binding response regulator [Bacteroidales bacterium]|nr:DNA-binding response regulator [Bacteroidales bacterium]